MIAMRITLNNEEIEVAEGSTLADLIDDRGLSRAACATEVNRRLVRKSERPDTPIKPGDRIEIVTLVGGG